MEHLTILKLIEEVDPSDKDKLNEIDARVWCWLHSHIFHRVDYAGLIKSCFYTRKNEIEENWYHMGYIRGYSRSRDALKKIRPEDWFPMALWMIDLGVTGEIYQCTIIKYILKSGIKGQDGCEYTTKEITSQIYCRTEELAELHAIIQAIAYERSVQCTNI